MTGIAEPFLDPGEEQGSHRTRWQPDRAGAYAANFVVIAGVTPIVEELMFRGAAIRCSPASARSSPSWSPA